MKIFKKIISFVILLFFVALPVFSLNYTLVRAEGTEGQECGALADEDNEWARERLEEAEEADRGIFTEGLTPECMAFGCCGICDIMVVISNVFQFAFTIVGIAAVLVTAVAGIMYITSGGNQEQVGKAKAALTAAVIGTVITLASWLIINAVLNAAGYNDAGTWFNPSC